ncbi:putative phosphatase YwpJ [compost metagenome]
MFKLVALDVDGTLLNDKYQITERTVRVVRGVVETGARIILCTGRSPISLNAIQHKLGIKEPCIVHNGSAILSSDGEVIRAVDYSMQELLLMINFCRKENIHFNACTVNEIYVESEGYEEQYRKYFLKPNRINDLLSLNEPIVKFSIYAKESDIERFLKQDWNTSEMLSIVRAGKTFVDIMMKGVSKGNALLHLAESLNYKSKDIVAIGDQHNDIEMLRCAGLGIAMGNAPEEVARVADWKTDTNNEDGVAKALVRLFELK